MTMTITKARAYMPIAVDLLFDTPRKGIIVDGVTWVEPWPMWLVKEWFRTDNGLGRTAVSCRWPRPTLEQLRTERIECNAWLESFDEDDDD